MKTGFSLSILVAIFLVIACSDSTTQPDQRVGDGTIAADRSASTDSSGVMDKSTNPADGAAVAKLNWVECTQDVECLSGKCEDMGGDEKMCMKSCTTKGSTTECPANEKCWELGVKLYCAPTCTGIDDPNCTARHPNLDDCNADGICDK